MRGTFAARVGATGLVGGGGAYTVHLPDGDEGFILRRRDALTEPRKVPLAIIAGREYSRVITRLRRPRARPSLGVRFALAESFERIHRSNLVGMGILPLQFQAGRALRSLGLTGRERSAQ